MDASTNSLIQTRVMRRVRTIHALRRFINSPATALLFFAAALWGIGREVWVARVFQNMPSLSDATGVLRFFTNAFLHTDVLVQGLCLIAAIALLWMLRDIARNLARPLHFA